MTDTARVTFHHNCYWLYAPYHAEFLAALKARIPSRHRKWRPGSHEWRIDVEYEEALFRTLDEYFDGIHWLPAEEVEKHA